MLESPLFLPVALLALVDIVIVIALLVEAL
jgi:hypothetical protein